MKWATLVCLGLVLFISFIQCQEGEQESTEKQSDDVLGRAGLLASDLNVSPTGQQVRTGGTQIRNAAVTAAAAAAAAGAAAQSACCCVRKGTRCPVPYGNGGNGFLDIVNPRGSFEEEEDDDDDEVAADGDDEPTEDTFAINTRIFNDPIEDGSSGASIRDCPRRHKRCCYSTLDELASISDRCSLAGGSAAAGNTEPWTQRCKEKVPKRPRQCGERQFTHVSGLQKAEASPYEFPWSCLVLDSNNRYIATCAIIPNNPRNRVNKGTDRVITVAHRLFNISADSDLKVRVLEYNALGNEFPELEPHQEFRVVRKRLHPQFLLERLSHDMAVLHLDRNIPLKSTRGINAACLPNCDDMFSFQFSNGTGVRCWVAGWGKDGPSGKFQPIQHKVDVPMFDTAACNTVLKSTLLRNSPAVGRRFVLSPSEICAGGEDRKDACEGDGGAPLVCQATSGRWHVVGLVAWGISCGTKGLPGVYANVYNMLDFILA